MAAAKEITAVDFQRQIDALGECMDKGFDELKNMLRGYEGRLRIVEGYEAGCQPLITKRILDVEKDVQDHTDDIEALKLTVTGLIHTNKILTWIGGIAGSALVLWIIAQLLGLIAS